ncbi:MAG: tRNA (guanosine(37)-N1)-methyltransferase TrmD [Candidatus Parcubacteria bacterium]|nr:tRNA (guanosine(37)-N1)-methyltransferase TrmD [Candidatus Parcubacteria bacterium]
MLKFNIITIFPQIFDSYFAETILARAQKNNLIEIKAHDLRQWTDDNHKSVDDSPYGGGPGMVMMVEPIFKAVETLRPASPELQRGEQAQGIKQRIILFSAKGKQFTQVDARRLAAEYDEIIMICGRYEGVDERVAQHIADEELSVGNFVLTGGEIPAMIVVDAVSRLLPGVLGKEESLKQESFSEEGYLEYPQYTRPEEFNDWKVPEILLSGDHKKIEEWRKNNSGR